MSIIVNHSHHYRTHIHTRCDGINYHSLSSISRFQLRDHFPSLTQSENYFLFESSSRRIHFHHEKNCSRSSTALQIAREGRILRVSKKNDKRLKLIGAFKSINGSEKVSWEHHEKEVSLLSLSSASLLSRSCESGDSKKEKALGAFRQMKTLPIKLLANRQPITVKSCNLRMQLYAYDYSSQQFLAQRVLLFDFQISWLRLAITSFRFAFTEKD